MDFFSIRGAWRNGLRFLSGRMLHHTIILLGVGIVPAYCLPLALGAPVGEPPTPALAAQNAFGTMPAGGAVAMLVLALGYVLQTGSYFASWRRGLSSGGSLGGALGFGLLAGLLTTMIYVALIAAAAFAAGQIGSFGAWLLGILVLLIPLAIAFAVFYTLFAALLAFVLATALVLAMVFGAVMGQIGFAATLVGGSGVIVVALLVMSVIMLWLAARFSCVTSVMAERRSFNLIAAMGESWRLTLEDQWAIVRYLVLIAFALALVLAGIGMAAGLGARAFVEGGLPEGTVTAALIGMAISLPLAFLAVLVPAGIYRELDQGSETAGVFA